MPPDILLNSNHPRQQVLSRHFTDEETEAQKDAGIASSVFTSKQLGSDPRAPPSYSNKQKQCSVVFQRRF